MSLALPALLNGAHLLSLLAGGGLALGADRATLRAAARPLDPRRAELDALAAARRPALLALAAALASGALAAAADGEAFLASPLLLANAALAVLLVANALVMARAGASLRRIEMIRRIGFDVGRRSGPRLWRRLRACAWASLALWGAAAVAGAAWLGLG